MPTIQAIILGIIQGVTEFFPISSSTHLKVARSLMNMPDGNHWLYFDLACHVGTWLAMVIFLRKEIVKTLQDSRKIALFAIALLPLIPAYFLLRPLRASLADQSYVGYSLLATSALLFLATLPKIKANTHKWPNVLFVGMMQAGALIPGISRSGATMAGARFCGWSWLDAATWSFLLAIPTTLGGEVLESYKLWQDSSDLTILPCLIGLVTSFIVGLMTIRLAFWFYERGIIKPFAWYCLGFGLFLILVLHG